MKDKAVVSRFETTFVLNCIKILVHGPENFSQH